MNQVAARRLRRSPHDGFTLVEMLVVIAIVSLLVSLLLPALSAARAVANAGVCMAHMRQQGIVVLNYCSANKQAFPFEQEFYGNYNGLGPSISWGTAAQLLNSGDLDRGPTQNFLPVGGPWAPNVYCPGILNCPGEASTGIAGYLSTNNGQVSVAATYRNGYTRNVLIAGAADVRQAAYVSGYSPPMVVLKTHYTFSGLSAGVRSFSYGNLQLPMVNYMPYGLALNSTPPLYNVDAPTQATVEQAVGGQGLWIAYDGVLYVNGIVYRHPNRTSNFLYLDGHVVATKPSDIDCMLSQSGGDPVNSWDARMSLGGNSK